MAFQDVLNEVSAQLAALGALTSTIHVGRKHRYEMEAPRRIVFVPTRDSFAEPSGPGGNPRPLHDVTVGGDVHLWTESHYLTQVLRDQFIVALRRALKRNPDGARMSGTYKLTGGEWTTETDHESFGEEYTLGVSFVVPVVERTEWPATPSPENDAAAVTHPKVPSGTKQEHGVTMTLGTPPTDQGTQTITGPTTP